MSVQGGKEGKGECVVTGKEKKKKKRKEKRKQAPVEIITRCSGAAIRF